MTDVIEYLADLGHDPTDEHDWRASLVPFELPPEKALMQAVFDEARADLRRTHERCRDCYRTARGCATEWITGRDDSWIFSFKNVCEALGLDPSAVRAELLG